MRWAAVCVGWEVVMFVMWLFGHLDAAAGPLRDARTRAMWALARRNDARPLARVARLERRWRWWMGR